VTKLTNFGAFVELEPDLEGLLHISELADHKIEKPQDIVKLGEEIEVKILRVDTEARKIGLSLRRVRWAAEEQASESDQKQTPINVQTVLPDIDTVQVEKPQEKAGEPEQTTSESSQPSEQDAESRPETPEAVESGAGDAEQAKEIEESEQAEAEQTQESSESQSRTGGDCSTEEKADN
jgi:small subunit ribosomal protein S1